MKARILIIEDEPAINDLLCMNLEVAGYETASYLDGNAASKGITEDHDFQCALVDIMLPGKDGYALLPELTHYKIPVIFLTAKADVAHPLQPVSDPSGGLYGRGAQNLPGSSGSQGRKKCGSAL